MKRWRIVCARAGYSLVLVARSADKLRVLAKALSAVHGVKAWVSGSVVRAMKGR